MPQRDEARKPPTPGDHPEEPAPDPSAGGKADQGRQLQVSWKHRPGDAGSCAMASDTGRTFQEILALVSPLLEADGITVSYEDVTLPPGASPGDEGVFLNGRPLSLLLSGADVAQFICHASRCQPYEGNVTPAVTGTGSICLQAPEILFRKAFLMAIEGD